MMNCYTACHPRGSKMFVRGYRDGVRFLEEVDYKPSFYKSTRSNDHTEYSVIDHGKIRGPVYRFRDSMPRVRKLLMNGDGVCGMTNFVTQFLIEQYPDEIQYQFEKLTIAYLDIEVESEAGFSSVEDASEAINLVSVKINGITHVISTHMMYFTGPIKVYHVKTERDIISKFFTILGENDVDIITGWNIKLYDIPYIIRRAMKLFSEDTVNSWMPFGFVNERIIETDDNKYLFYDLGGYSVLDFMDLYKKFSGKKQESYSLNHIAEAELNEKKHDYSKYGSLRNMYRQNFREFAEYNIQDVGLVERLEHKLNLLRLAVSICYEAKIVFDRVFMPTQIWEAICCSHLLGKRIVPALHTAYEKDKKFEGAFVKEIKPGLYRNIVSLDATSLYPSIIQSLNISPETLRGKIIGIEPATIAKDPTLLKEITPQLLQENCALACNGCVFSKDTMGFIPYLIESTLRQRREAKNRMLRLEQEYEKTKDESLVPQIAALKIRQDVKKVLANSLYGCMGTPSFIFSSPELATAVTLTGQSIITTTESHINRVFNAAHKNKTPKDYVIAMDTDSMYLNMEDVVADFRNRGDTRDIVTMTADIVKKGIQPILNECTDGFMASLNCMSNKISFKLEYIASSGFWTAKKNYALLVDEKEGVRYEGGRMFIKGLASQRSSTPAVMQKHLKKCAELIARNDKPGLKAYVSAVEKEYADMSIAQISPSSKVSGMVKYGDSRTIYIKGTPIATKAALLHNHYVQSKGLEQQIPLVTSVDRVKIVALKKPNPFGLYHDADVFGFVNEPAKELNLDRYVDREKQFKKIFMSHLDIMLSAVGWTLTKAESLDDMFA